MPPLKYENTNNFLEAFRPILQDHGQWFHDLLEHLFYPDEHSTDCELQAPTSFARWSVSVSQEKTVRPEIIERLNALHTDLFSKAAALCDVVNATGKKPGYKKFKELITLFEEFVFYVRRLEEDLLEEERGFDPITGLRSKSMLVGDVSREMERLARQGKSFCLALARIDHFAEISGIPGSEEGNKYTKLLAGLIKISIRSFDDAYYMEDGVFALCLKQADITGGFSALERLRKELEQQKISVRFSGKEERPLSMSCCIAEPVVGDVADELMYNLSRDLAESDMESTDTVLKFRELSALERYAQDVE